MKSKKTGGPVCYAERTVEKQTASARRGPYLQSLPTDLKSTGGSQAFQAVTISILGSKKSFTDEYATGDSFWLNYVFRVADVESFAAQKIDAQQLLDRGHLSQDGLGRISVKLVAGQ